MTAYSWIHAMFSVKTKAMKVEINLWAVAAILHQLIELFST